MVKNKKKNPSVLVKGFRSDDSVDGVYYLRVGDKVKTGYNSQQRNVVRSITSIESNSRFGSGAFASADGGEACSHCHRHDGSPINDVDACWFVPVGKVRRKP